MRRLIVLPVLFLAVGVSIAQETAPARTVPVTLAGLPPDAAPAIRVTARPVSREGKPVEAQRGPDGVWTFALAPGSWEVSATAEGWWFAPVPVLVGAASPPPAIELPARRAGLLTGTLLVEGRPPRDVVPPPLVVSFRDPARRDGRAAWDGDAACSVQGDGAFSCRLPVGIHDVRLRARGFISHYRWSASVDAAQPLRAGPIDLRPGASVVGFVVTPERNESLRDARVRLERAGFHGGAPAPPGSGSLASMALETTPRENGFFAFDGVPPGEYLLVASKPRYAEASVRARVLADLELRLKNPLVLQPPAEVQVYVDPPVAPDGSPWTVRVVPIRGGRRQQPVSALAELNGAATLTDVAGGEHHLEVADAQGATWYAETGWTLVPGEGPKFVTISVVDVVGRVSFGDEPLRNARLTFGADGLVRVPLVTDEEGEFAGSLPRPGPWKVHVGAAVPKVNRTLSQVEVPKPKGGKSRVDLHLGDRGVSGTVVRADTDEPVANATVAVLPQDMVEHTASVLTAADGSFELEGLDGARYWLTARAQGVGRSAAESVDLRQASKEGHLLRLIPSRKHVLEVVSSAGPVPAARVLVKAGEMAGGDVIRPLVTGADGTAGMEIDPAWSRVSLDILALGYAYWFGALDTGARTYHRVALEPGGGTLVLDLAGVDAEAGEATILLHDGGFTWPGMLTQWSSMNGMAPQGPSSTLTVPRMGTGTYALCRISAAEAAAPAAFATAGGARSRCASGVLVPAGTLALSVPPA